MTPKIYWLGWVLLLGAGYLDLRRLLIKIANRSCDCHHQDQTSSSDLTSRGSDRNQNI